MSCETCGEVCSCPMEPSSGEPNPDTLSAGELHARESPAEDLRGNPEAWRTELAARLNRYRARRGAPAPRYPSLTLPFDDSAKSKPEASHFQGFDGTANHALALDGACHDAAPSEDTDRAPLDSTPVVQEQPAWPLPSAKIIEFPRSAWNPPPPPPDQLAEPVGQQLRIFEVPEAAPPPPALGGITIEPIPAAEPERRPGIDFPLQSAPLARRAAACLIDGIIVAAAAVLFGYIFWRVAGMRPPRMQLFGMAAGVVFVLWAGYHYLLMVYSASTPGLRGAGLELARFDGSPTRRSRRRWRILASYLSAVSLGMGYAWVFLDEDGLCWHDRITRTYLAPRRRTDGSNRT